MVGDHDRLPDAITGAQAARGVGQHRHPASQRRGGPHSVGDRSGGVALVEVDPPPEHQQAPIAGCHGGDGSAVSFHACGGEARDARRGDLGFEPTQFGHGVVPPRAEHHCDVEGPAETITDLCRRVTGRLLRVRHGDPPVRLRYRRGVKSRAAPIEVAARRCPMAGHRGQCAGGGKCRRQKESRPRRGCPGPAGGWGDQMVATGRRGPARASGFRQPLGAAACGHPSGPIPKSSPGGSAAAQAWGPRTPGSRREPGTADPQGPPRR